jgi:hypothetical protein
MSSIPAGLRTLAGYGFALCWGKGFGSPQPSDLATFCTTWGFAWRISRISGRNAPDQHGVPDGVGVALLAFGAFGHQFSPAKKN